MSRVDRLILFEKCPLILRSFVHFYFILLGKHQIYVFIINFEKKPNTIAYCMELFVLLFLFLLMSS